MKPFSPVTLCLLASGPLADTLLVQPGESIQAAVDAAAPGDTLCLVAGGEYHSASTLLVAKPLTIVAGGSEAFAEGARLLVPVGDPSNPVLPLRIEGIPAGTELRIFNLEVVSLPKVGAFFQDSPELIEVVDCAGSVVLNDVQAIGGSVGTAVVPGVISIYGSQRVVLDRCHIEATTPGILEQPAPNPAGLYAEDSTVFVNASWILGSPGTGSTAGPDDGTPGARVVNSSLSIAQAYVVGGAGDSGGSGASVSGGNGGPAIHASASQVEVRGGYASKLLIGGNGSLGSPGGTPAVGSGGPAVLLDGGATLVSAGDAELQGGWNASMTVQAPSVDASAGGTWTPVPERLATASALPLLIAPGGPAALQLSGEPHGALLIGFSLPQGPALVLPSTYGPLCLNLAGLWTIPPYAFGATGQGLLPFVAPQMPGVSIVIQALAVHPTGLLSISPPTFLSLDLVAGA